MNILIVRMIAVEEDCSDQTYNSQGIGLALELSKLGHKCGLVYYAKRGNAFNEVIERDGYKINVYHIEGFNIFWNAVYNRSIYKLCEVYDIIQASECDQIFSWMLYKKYPNKTLIYHGPYRSKFTWKYNLRASLFDKIFTWRANFRNVYVLTKSYLAENYLRKKKFKNVKTVGVGLNQSYIDRPIDEEKIPTSIIELINSKMDRKYILYIGSISKRKNFTFIIDILNKLVKEEKKFEYSLIVVGDKAYKEEGYYKKCLSRIEKYNLENNVIFLGKVEQQFLKYIYEVSDVFVLPTKYDIFGMVYLEAMYFGLPIVTTKCGGSTMLIKNGETGFIKDLDDIDGWVESLSYICSHEEYLNKMKSESKKMIRSRFLWSCLAPEFEKMYVRVLNND